MPKRDDIHSVLVIGSGPIVIGQAAEFDYSGTQACRALREEGIRVILINSNPATIMTDPDFADATYVEPITWEVIETIIAKEKPDAILPTLGGQTALNAAIQLHHHGILEKYDVELIGANFEAINKGEDRQIFKQLVLDAGADVARSHIAHTVEEAVGFAADLGYPLVVRPSFTMGGLGSGFAYTPEELIRIVTDGLHQSPTTEVLLEESILGWKEYELELMRDTADNTVVVCSIENVDPVGVHTGDSITVAPALTLTDREYQNLRDIGIDIIRAVGVDTGGCNIQFAIDPSNGRVIVIEMNPRVSRSSALASKATGFPIAKIAAKLAIGYRLDEIPNDITKVTPASFEPTLDYVVVKVPRFAFEKFPAADATLTTTMKSVGEAMAIGRNYSTALQKALRSLEKRGSSFHWNGVPGDKAALLAKASVPTDGRIVTVQQALRAGATIEEVFESTKIDPWFIDQIVLINEVAEEIGSFHELDERILRLAKDHGFSDVQIAELRGIDEAEVRSIRHSHGVRPVFKTVDTCAGEFPALTPYHYSSYDLESEVRPSDRRKVVILGSGPNRIGQGVEFDYSCVQASFALSEAGYETIMINCNPETVSTDYDTSDRLYFEPLTLEDVLEVIHAESQSGELVGVVVQLGGQTALGLAKGLKAAGVTILGTTPEAIDLAEERGLFQGILDAAGLVAPRNGTAFDYEGAVAVAEEIGYPVLVRPSYVLGGRGMEIVYDSPSLDDYFVRVADQGIVGAEHPLLVDRFLDDAIEIDIDALYDGTELYVGGVMEHIEEAGIHSGDSSCTLPPVTLGREQIARVVEATRAIAEGVGVRGLINVQFAIGAGVLYVLEANPRASRTVPFVAKALGLPIAKAASLIMVGESIRSLVESGMLPEADGSIVPMDSPVAVKEAVLPFKRFRTKDGLIVDSVLGPEMRSTGEVMGIDANFPTAFAKSQEAAYGGLPTSGSVFVSVADRDKRAIILPVLRLQQLGFEILGTIGTAEVLSRNGITATVVRKYDQGEATLAGEPSIVDLINRGEVDIVINTPSGRAARADGYEIRAAAVAADLPLFTTIAQLGAAVASIEATANSFDVKSLQDYALERAERLAVLVG
ncbi:carbamoyl-phosphate synthase large subunit [Lacisediminihabitans changchengi]|uniref:Carbamoyl phosphate synthase large chain n=1 Tax=Lacisediminihabitans changchengi TaxID=2787634 RepID=A0A934SM54_9MICO|nr:carbamoyl-phosphate synthase large subunit [Lacisediminihabitans changchengi]MBK4346789.1 carbamoyl-phosphate synthase large subunit [Lacisediminihabitans changchengi]MBK4348088.1 carbamoyl-phosphate synthase large subunit [Lacisediminihabitans changchengi]